MTRHGGTPALDLPAERSKLLLQCSATVGASGRARGHLLHDMQGINRLGKGAPKPGSLRPPDPNRRQDLDLFSEGAETDADYMRMVHDVRPGRAFS